MHWKQYIPYSFRLYWRQFLRRQADRRQGITGRLAVQTTDDAVTWPYVIQALQEIKPSAFFENKLHNMRLAATRVTSVEVKPGAVFSFWHCVGKPNMRMGYKAGRNLVNGRLQAGVGGGLCQLSGILYFLSLKSGLEVIERHHHSIDIYQEHERFAPLGADATVVFGYKDFRFRNNLDFPIRLEVAVSDSYCITAAFHSPQEIQELAVEFHRSENNEQLAVLTMREGVAIARSVYKRRDAV